MRYIRYKLKKGKFGCYFYDSSVELNLTLEMVLNRLNGIETLKNKLNKYRKVNREQLFDIVNLKQQIRELKNE